MPDSHGDPERTLVHGHQAIMQVVYSAHSQLSAPAHAGHGVISTSLLPRAHKPLQGLKGRPHFLLRCLPFHMLVGPRFSPRDNSVLKAHYLHPLSGQVAQNHLRFSKTFGGSCRVPGSDKKIHPGWGGVICGSWTRTSKMASASSVLL